MAEILLNKVLNHEIDLEAFYMWIFNANSADPAREFKFNCSRTDFVTYFLNYIHDTAGSFSNNPETVDDVPKKRFSERNANEINKSHSCPLDLSAESHDSFASATSTPKVPKVGSDSALSYTSPISPLYKPNHSFSGAKAGKKITPQKVCLGDFIINRKSSTKKKSKSPDTKRRIKPTNIALDKSSFHKSENSFNFSKNDVVDKLPDARSLLVEETLKILPKSVNLNRSKNAYKFNEKAEIAPQLCLVSYKKSLDEVIKIYSGLIERDFVLNLYSEIYFLISLLFKKQFDDFSVGLEILHDRILSSQLFLIIHNVIYFASKCLESQLRIVSNFDKATLKLLYENDRLKTFVPGFVCVLKKIKTSDKSIEISRLIVQDNVCFNSDTDNRQNFPNDATFHAFRKQRDLFYEILRIWEQQHLSPGFNFALSLGGKIRSLLSLSIEPTNSMHFARLFKAQLLSTCTRGAESDFNFIESLGVDKEKLNRLKSRCETKDSCHGLNSLPKFNDREEFYRDFILVGLNHCFVRHLVDAIVEEIQGLNGASFICDLDEEDKNVDLTTKKSYYTSVRALRLLAKFQGFLDSLPYKTDVNKYSENILTAHLQIRHQVHPSFDVKSILESSIRRRSTILCIPWLTNYLSMLDAVTLKLPYYTSVLQTLFWLHRNFKNVPRSNVYLIKFCLGWLFELPNFPDLNYFDFCHGIETSPVITVNGFSDHSKINLDQLEIVDQDILYLCCPYLDEIKKVLSTNFSSNSYTTKHITPVTALQSPDEIARKRLEQQLEEAFFNGQPISIRKTVEFVSERVASTCVKHICATVVPNHKKGGVERLKQLVKTSDKQDDINAHMLAMKAKANHLATTCLKELQEACANEIENVCAPKISRAIESLVSLDTLPETVSVCVGITKKICAERVRQWMNTHVTSAIFTKDFNDEIQKSASICDSIKKFKKPVFVLPPGGSKIAHNDVTTSGVHLLEKLRDSCVGVLEHSQLSESRFLELLDETLKSFIERGDMNECISASICTILVDLSVLLLAHNCEVISKPDVLQKLSSVWKLYFSDTDELFKSLICLRNVMILAQSNNPNKSWKAFARFCAYLVRNQILSRDSFEGQCTGLFKTDWDEVTLKNITDFLKEFVRVYKDVSDFTFLLDFLSDYCEDL